MEEPRRLGGRYELGSVLGRGGMAEVYLAHDTRLGRTVAVKTLRVDLARDPSFQARFRREAQSAASLNHPAIVAVYDTGEDMVPDNGTGEGGVSIPYIVMEYVDGSTLRELLHSGRKLLPERAMEMCVGILQALEYSHRNGIVHRDIKPANVMLTRNGQVKVMDFGIARAMGDSGVTMTQTAAVIGTAQYLSPEQAKGETVDSRSDLYSTGCLLYELLTVRPPFVGDSPVAVAYQHVREEPQSPSAFDPEITPETDAIVLRALVKDPDFRYQTADEMRADIEACLDGQPVAATSALGAVGYPDEQPTTALRAQNPQTSMMAPVGDDDGSDDPRGRRRPPKKNRTSTVLLVIAALLVLVGAIFVGKALFGKSSSSNVTVPDLAGLSYSEAQEQGQNGGFEVTKGKEKYCKQPKGKICDSNPAEDTEIERGETVTLSFSKGDRPVEVPEVTDKNFDQAKTELEAEGFKVKRDEQQSPEEENSVLEQDPAGTQQAQRGSTVTLTVAVAQKTEVPNVVGKSFEEAETELKDLEFEVARKDEETEDKPADEVTAQDPAASTSHPKGTQITLTVAKAPEEEPAKVPNVTNKPLGEAKGELEDAGFKIGDIRGPGEDEAIVVATQPGADTDAKKGDEIGIMTRPPGPDDGNGDDDGGDGGGWLGGPVGG